MLNYTHVDAQSRGVIHCSQMKIKMLALASGLIVSALVFSFIFKVPQVHAQTSCDYYASPNGTGNGISPSTSFQISTFWSIATPGKTLCLLDGTYTGANSMIQPPSSFAGTLNNPITIRALNEGKVLIDGGTGRPISLLGTYGILEGVNARGGDNAVLAFRYASSHWIVRRVVVWDLLGDVQGDIVAMAGSNNLLEDCGIFGKARKGVAAGANGGTNNVVRRCWVRWESKLYAGGSGPTPAMELGYDQDNVTFENVVATRDVVGPTTEPEAPLQLFATKNSKVLGSIMYLTDTANFDTNKLFFASTDGGSNYQNGQFHTTDNVLVKDVVAYVSPTHPRFGQIAAFSFGKHDGPDGKNFLANLVGVAGATSYCLSPTWDCSGLRLGTSLAQAIGAGKSIWNEVPGICKRYVNGVLTTTPLWPWPMNQRIKDALVQSGRSPVDVTQTMEGMFGTIAQACKTDTPNTAAMPAPRNLRATGAN